MSVRRKQFKVFADYRQFYLWDAGMSPSAPEEYSDEDVKYRIKTGPHVVVIQPERNTTVDVTLEIHSKAPAFDPADWDHIAEASLHLPKGRLQVHECTGKAVANFKVEPGWYRIRSFHGGLGTISTDQLEGGDRYLVVIWPAKRAALRVIKQWQSQG